MRMNNPQLHATMWMKLTNTEPDARELVPYYPINIKYKKEAKLIYSVRNQKSGYH